MLVIYIYLFDETEVKNVYRANSNCRKDFHDYKRDAFTLSIKNNLV